MLVVIQGSSNNRSTGGRWYPTCLDGVLYIMQQLWTQHYMEFAKSGLMGENGCGARSATNYADTTA